MDDIDKKRRARKELHRMARSKFRKKMPKQKFEIFIRNNCSSKIEVIGEKEFEHLISLVFD